MSATLRRADWRFLLPVPPAGHYRRMVLLGGPAGLAELLRKEGIAEQLHTRPVRGTDLLIALGDHAVSVPELARLVVPGGVVYREVDRSRPSMLATTPNQLARAFKAAGLHPVWSHWVIPGFDQARRYLPLDHPEALRWYFATLHPAGSLPGALAAAVAEWLGQGQATGLAMVAPSFSMTAIAGAGISAANAVLELPTMPRRWRAPGTRLAMLTSGEDDGSRVVLLPFATQGAAPDAVVKLVRAARFNGHTQREQATLAAIRSRLDAELRPSIPEPGGAALFGRCPVALESYAPGASMVRSTGRRGEPLEHSIEDLRAAADWLARFHQQTVLSLEWERREAERIIERLEVFRAHFATSPADHRLIDRAAALARGLVGARLPTVLVHNDYGPWNIHRDGDRITVIDWELGPGDTGGRRGPALSDLLYFVTEWHLRARRLRGRQAELRGFRELFLRPTGPAAAAATEAVSAYMHRLGVDSRFLPLLLVTTWADRAVDRADRQVTATGSASGENRYAEYVRLIAAEADERFWEGPR